MRDACGRLAPDAICDLCFPADAGASLARGARRLRRRVHHRLGAQPLRRRTRGRAADRAGAGGVRLAHAVFRLLLGLAGRLRRRGRAGVRRTRAAARSASPATIWLTRGGAAAIRCSPAGRRPTRRCAAISTSSHCRRAASRWRPTRWRRCRRPRSSMTAGLFWGVQYHPEYSISPRSRRSSSAARRRWRAKAWRRMRAAARGVAQELRALDAGPRRRMAARSRRERADAGGAGAGNRQFHFAPRASRKGRARPGVKFWRSGWYAFDSVRRWGTCVHRAQPTDFDIIFDAFLSRKVPDLANISRYSAH